MHSSVQLPVSSYFGFLWNCVQYYVTAKSLKSCPTLCDPVDYSPPGSPVPGILQARTLEWGAIAFSSLGWEDPLKKEMATYSSILSWEMPWTEELVDYSPSSQKELDTIERAHTHTLL